MVIAGKVGMAGCCQLPGTQPAETWLWAASMGTATLEPAVLAQAATLKVTVVTVN